MKILYAIQGTGNGHISRAREIIPILLKNHDLDILISGTQAEVELPYPVKYKLKGLGFIFGQNGGIDLLKTYKKTHIKTLINEINSIPINTYSLILNDFEPVTAWACYLTNTPCIAISHQAAVLHKNAPQVKKINKIGKAILRNYAPATVKYGFHFKPNDTNIFTPVIRKEIRQQEVKNLGHYTVYLPAYSDTRILNILKQCDDVKWQVFSKHNKQPLTHKNITIQPINNDAFIASMATSAGVLCGAGFETPAEALFMKKKLMVIPMKNQIEQQCNAAALKEMGVKVIKSFKKKHIDTINHWINSDTDIEVDYPDNIESIVNDILTIHSSKSITQVSQQLPTQFSAKKLRTMMLKKIVLKSKGKE
jgi:uncharacterized protein (TIGR00661 family)